MFVGHYGVSLGLKYFTPKLSLGWLFLAVQWVDVVWGVMVLAGVEKVRIVPGFTAASPLDLYYMPFTHSLAATLAWALGAFLLTRSKGLTVALAIAAAVASHLHWM